ILALFASERTQSTLFGVTIQASWYQSLNPIFIFILTPVFVTIDLPEKTEMNLYSALTEEQKTVYLAYLRQMREEITSMDSEAFK
ncbi:hypothetical protein, partial [Enterococcus faecium]|uniref:hypothetical protein n=1 Tax=Enterococcus faecium TaxID=1352 RepID=UPI00292F579E